MKALKELVRPNIWNLSPYSSARDEFTGEGEIFLDANENPFGTLNRYPDPYQRKLKGKLSELKGVSAEQIFIGNGSDEIIDLAYRIFCEPKQDSALTFSPTYGMYDVSAGINGVELEKISLSEDFQIAEDTIGISLRNENLKLVFMCSPNNPTGNNLSSDSIEFVLKNFDGIVIIDEAYADFSSQPSWINRLDEFPNLIVMQTFSKARALAAVRIGVMYASPELVGLFNKVKPPYNVSGLNMEAAFKSLHDQDQFEQNVQLILNERSRLEKSLIRLKIVKKVYPSKANFLLVEFDAADAIYEALVNRKVIVRNRNQVVNNCLRITVGSPSETKKLIENLTSIASETK